MQVEEGWHEWKEDDKDQQRYRCSGKSHVNQEIIFLREPKMSQSDHHRHPHGGDNPNSIVKSPKAESSSRKIPDQVEALDKVSECVTNGDAHVDQQDLEKSEFEEVVDDFICSWSIG